MNLPELDPSCVSHDDTEGIEIKTIKYILRYVSLTFISSVF